MVSRFYQKEMPWQSRCGMDEVDGNPRLELQKYIQIENTLTNEIVKIYTISLFLTKGNVEFIKKLLSKKNIFQKVIDFVKRKKPEYYLASLMPLFNIRVFGENWYKNYGTSNIILHTATGETYVEQLQYEYNDETDPILMFYPEDKMVAARLYHAFIANRIKKVELIPTEDKTFDRIYFDIIDNNYFLLRKEVISFAEKQNFRIINI